jgi:hypothetical protein
MSGQNVYFDITIDNNPAGRITFKVNTKTKKKEDFWKENIYLFFFFIALR